MPDQWAIFDIDGTLSDCTPRVHLAQARQWDAFHTRCGDDFPHEAECRILRMWHAAGHPVALITGRTEPYRVLTRLWLRKQRIPFDVLLMRQLGDVRPSTEVKLEQYHQLRKIFAPMATVAFVMEDQDKLVAMWRELGLTCLQPRPGAF
jgi:hypothetical protein